jgi:hypothetical protein
MAYTLAKVKRLHKLFIDTLTAEHALPAVKDWNAQDESLLSSHLGDRTPWIVVLPTQIDPTEVPAVWLIAQGVTIPESIWESDEEYRIWCFANAWRLALDVTKTIASPDSWIVNPVVQPAHIESSAGRGPAGMRLFRVHSMTQKDAVLGAVRRAYVEVLSRSGSMAAADTADSLSHGSALKSNKLKRSASEDAIDKAVLFIGTQCNWIKNPAFKRPDYLHSLDDVGSSGLGADIIWYDSATILSFVYETAAFWHKSSLADKNLLHLEAGKYIGTMLFGWSALYSIVDLPGSNHSGSMGDDGSIMRSLWATMRTGVSDALCYGSVFPVAGVHTVDNPMWAFRFVCGSMVKHCGDISRDTRQAYLPFPKTWNGEISPSALLEIVGSNVAASTAVYGAATVERLLTIYYNVNLAGRVTSVPIRKELVNANIHKFLPLLIEP